MTEEQHASLSRATDNLLTNYLDCYYLVGFSLDDGEPVMVCRVENNKDVIALNDIKRGSKIPFFTKE